MCKATEIADTDSDVEDSEPGSDDEKEDKDKDEEDQVATKSMGLHDSDGEDEEQREGKKEIKKDPTKLEDVKEGTAPKSDTAQKHLVRGAWPCWEDRSVFAANQSIWAPLLVHYSVCQNLQG